VCTTTIAQPMNGKPDEIQTVNGTTAEKLQHV